MNNYYYLFTIIAIFVSIFLLIGCGEEDSVEIQSVTPMDGSTIFSDGTIKVSFSGNLENLTVSKGEITITENTVAISGPFTQGTLEIELTWEGGNSHLTYTVEEKIVIPEGMVLIPEGEFQLGSISGEAGSVEQPGHLVYIDAFYIDIYEVTNSDYKKFIDANSEWQKANIDSQFHDGNYLAHWTENSYPSDKADHPVINVSWYAASAYSHWLEKRLPTEAEWEKAARGGIEGQKYPWGHSIDDTKANFSLNVGYTGSTKPVGAYPPNGYELYDIVGNVLEWCLDAFDRNYYEDPSDNNPISGSNTIVEIVDMAFDISTTRSVRGGLWVESGQPRIWITHRRGNNPAQTSHLTGFRCVKSVTQ